MCVQTQCFPHRVDLVIFILRTRGVFVTGVRICQPHFAVFKSRQSRQLNCVDARVLPVNVFLRRDSSYSHDPRVGVLTWGIF